MNDDDDAEEVAGGGSAIVLLSHNSVQTSRTIRRRKWITSCIEYLSDYDDEDAWDFYQFWYKTLTEEERNTKEIVYKILEYRHREIYGENPWPSNGYPNRTLLGETYDVLPEALRTDPKAFIAFTKSMGFSNTRTRYDPIPILDCFRDNFHCMEAACSRDSSYLQKASSRLQDDEQLVRVALFTETCCIETCIEYASERLLRDKYFIRDCFTYHVNHLGKVHWIKNILTGRFDLEDQIMFLDLIAPSKIPHAWKYFPHEIRNDKKTILRLLESVVELSKADHFVRLCSDTIQADTEVSKTMKQKMILSGKHNSWYNEGKTKDEILKAISTKEIACYENIPKSIQNDPEILKSAIDAGIIFWEHVPKQYLQKKESILALINDGSTDEELYSKIPDNLKKDPEIALAFITKIKCSYSWKEIFDNIPSLGQSREALFSIIRYGTDFDEDDDYHEYAIFYEEDFNNYLRNFSQDKEMMLALFENKIRFSYNIVDSRLLNDRDFMKSVSGSSSSTFILLATHEFQLRNLDLVQKAIRNLQAKCFATRYDEYVFQTSGDFFEGLAPQVWTHRSIAISSLLLCDEVLNSKMVYKCSINHHYPRNTLVERKWETYQIVNMLRGGVFMNDKEIVSLLVRYDSDNFAAASKELKNNREFVLQLVKENKRVLHHAGKELKYDEDILSVAIVKDAGTIIDCFHLLNSTGDENFLLEYASNVRSKIDRHDAFVKDFLRGISSIPTGSLPPKLRCSLYKLDQGTETSLVFKRLIAEFADVPVGMDFLNYKTAALVLQQFGLF